MDGSLRGKGVHPGNLLALEDLHKSLKYVDSQLAAAYAAKDITGMGEMLRQGASVYTFTGEEWISPSILDHAVTEGDTDILPVLLGYAEGPLSHFLEKAMEHGKNEVAELILSKIGDEEINRSTLRVAAKYGHYNIGRVLLEKVSATKFTDVKALHEVAQRDDADLRFMESLLEKGALIEGALEYAACSRRTEAAKFLLGNGADPDGQGRDGYTPLIRAAYMGRSEMVRVLLDGGATLNLGSRCKDWKCCPSPLCAAIAGGDDRHTLRTPQEHDTDENKRFNLVKFLLERGADVNFRCRVHGSALHWAVQKRESDPKENWDVKMVKILLDNGADINASCIECGTPLRHSIRLGRQEVVQLLVDRGADVHTACKGSGTPLHWAIVHGRKEVAVLLLEKGADVNACCDRLGTPLHLACAAGDIQEPAAVFLIENGADVNSYCARLGTPLHVASSLVYDLAMVRLLLKNGADVNASCCGHGTPLHKASGRDKAVRMVKLLLNSGANVGASCDNLGTPYDVARCLGRDGMPVRELLELEMEKKELLKRG
ncbi:MAG: hypothetical protein M1840_003253 [Geoglossum simile]|nr:MAG: hypothetical protein M1840_003253 [Geoglossum simile]